MTESRPTTTSGTEFRSRAWRKGKVVEEDFSFERISDFIAEDGCLVWVDLSKPGDRALAALADELSLEENVIEDAVAENERPKVHHYDKFKFVTAYGLSIDPETGDLRQARVSAFVTKKALVTVRPDGVFDLEPLLKRWDESTAVVAHGVGGLLHGLLDLIVDSHFEAVQQLDDAIEGIEDGLFAEKSQDRQTQRRAFQFRKTLVQMRRVVLPMREVVGTLARRDEDADPFLRPYYDDLYDHVLRVTEWTESLRDMITSVFETNLSLADARLNTIMKKLTSWAAIIAVPTAVTGFYGQNIPYPGFGHNAGFLVSSAIMVVLVVFLYVTFRRKDWL
ncbi:MAG: magnesium transporter CorA family protein [Jatrophihabitans sp.]